MSVLVCCAYDRFLLMSPANGGGKLAVTPVYRMSSGPMRQLILLVHAATSNSYNWSSWHSRWTLASFVTSGNGGREGECSWLSHRCLEVKWANVAVESGCVHAVSVKQQLQRPPSAISLPSRWTLVSSGKLVGWSVHVYNTDRQHERGIMVKTVHITIEFLW